MTPISKGGTYDIENLQVLTWFENRAKCDMNQEEWEKFKKETNTTSAYFVQVFFQGGDSIDKQYSKRAYTESP